MLPLVFRNAEPACATPIPEHFATSEVARTSHLFLNFLSWFNFLAARVVCVILEKQNATDLIWEGIAV